MFPFQYHPRGEIVADSEQNNSDEKKSDSEWNNSDEKKSNSGGNNLDDMTPEVIVKDEELGDTQDSPQTLNEHQKYTQVRDPPEKSIEMQSIRETKQATS